MHQQLNHYQRELLKLGISEKDLVIKDLSYEQTNDLIKARELDNHEEEIARLQAMRQQTFKEVCPKIYHNSDFTLLSASTRDVLAFPYTKTGLIVNGVSGKGKTRAMWGLVKKLYVEQGISFEWLDALTFSDNSIAAARDNCLAKYVKTLSRFPLLVLDDLGKSKMTQKVGESLFGLLEERTSRERPTYITTNFVAETLSARFEDEETSKPLVRRLREFCKTITL
jgi:DNA replication protein DnaC